MPQRILLGPVRADFSDRQLKRLRAEGRCLTFGDDGTDVPLREHDTWAAFSARLPADFRPDLVAVWLYYDGLPDFLWDAPLPLVALAPDHDLRWQAFRRVLPRCEAVLTDAPGVLLLREHGIPDAIPTVLFGCPDDLLERPAEEPTRDIDVLFVGDANPAVGGERLPWLARVAALSDRWNVVVTDFQEAECRRLLARSRVVFNRSIRGECDRLVAETLAAGALLLQEADNREVPAILQPGRDYVAYDGADLEPLLERYLRDEDARRDVAESGRNRAANLTATVRLGEAFAVLDGRAEELLSRRAARRSPSPEERLADRIWFSMVRPGPDATLAGDLDFALRHRRDDPLLLVGHALALVRGVERPDLERASADLGRAARLLSGHPQVAAGLAEVLAGLGRRDEAARVAAEALAALDRDPPLPRVYLDLPPFAPGYDRFRVEWERAAWRGGLAGPAGEVLAKRELLRWRLHGLLAGWLDGGPALGHAYEEALARPDIASSRAALGCALARAGRLDPALAHLRAAVAANPFDAQALLALHELHHEQGDFVAADRLAAEVRRLLRAAPTLLPAQPWAHPEATLRTPSRPLSVVWEGMFRATHSLAHVNRSLADALERAGHSVHRSPVGPGEDAAGSIPATVDFHVTHAWPPRLVPPESGRWVVMQPWEYGGLPRDWADAVAANADEVWVPSHFVRDCCLRSGLPPELVHVVPLSVDPEVFRPDVTPPALAGRRGFTFLFVGGTLHRKGIDLLLEAFSRAFRPDEDVSLVVKDLGARGVYRGQTAGALVRRYENSGRTAPILHLDEEWPDERMPGLYAACDCVVLPYRGEGFGLPIVEAMASGRPVVVPAHGPALEVCDDSCAYFVASRTRPLGPTLDGMELAAPGWLGEPDPDALCLALRRAFEDRAEARSKGAAGRERAVRLWNPARTLAAVQTRLARLAEGEPRRERLAGRRFFTVATPREAAAPVEAALAANASLCLIVRDEEVNLRACVEPARHLFREVVVNDTGSRDGTVALARSLGAKVVEHPWADDFSAARNQSIDAASGDWVFWLDADDRLDAEGVRRLAHLLASLGSGPELAAYVMKCLCLPDASGRATAVDHVRLFPRRPDLRWTFRVHEQILPALNELGARIGWSDVVVQHTGYQDAALRGRKSLRDLRLLELELRDRPDHPFALFNLGSVLQEMGHHREAVPFLQRSLERSDPGDSITRKLFALLASSHRALGEAESALSACRAGLRLDGDDAELLHLQALLLRQSGDPAGAERSLRRLVTGRSAPHFGSSDPDLRGVRGWSALAEVLADLGRWPEAESAAAELDRRGAKAEALLARGRASLLRKDYGPSRAALESLTAALPDLLEGWVLLSYALLQEGSDPAAAERVLLRILELSPDDREARSNLEVLRRRR